MLGLGTTQSEGAFLLLPGSRFGGPLLHLDLGDEVAHIPYGGLRFFLVGRFDNVLDLLAGCIHRLKLESWHGDRPSYG